MTPLAIIEKNISLFKQHPQLQLARNIGRGVEKEALRVNSDGQLAQTLHPQALGSKLTHPNITTDYSEALLELITPPVASPGDILFWLNKLHYFIYQNIGEELLWPTSMPCRLGSNEEIPIADYGDSNSGQMKHIYRKGLAYRYDKHMQTIAGLHYNLSFPEQFWQLLQQLQHDTAPIQQFINSSYLGLIRNFQRLNWLVIYLFGASPVVCESYCPTNPLQLAKLGADTFYSPDATSLRMSDIGYNNAAQEHLTISYNNLEQYIHDLNYAISTPDKRYDEIGIFDQGGSYKQLSTNILQIEAEYYGNIRPKRTANSCERPTKALMNRGIEYIEVRALDINPYAACGIEHTQMLFLDAFLLYCQLQDSPAISHNEQQEIIENQRRIVLSGRKPNLQLCYQGKEWAMTKWLSELKPGLDAVCELLDESMVDSPYQAAITELWPQFHEPELSLSARIISDVKQYDGSFIDFALAVANTQRENFAKQDYSDAELKQLAMIAEDSIKEQKDIEKSDILSLAEYIANYFS